RIMAFYDFDYGNSKKKKKREVPLLIFLIIIALSADGILSLPVKLRDEYG
ncbi:MAG: hypothetical protein GY696_26990, partial [Gammaproteobacteria bacterium]|nr:hypothetical protein [Gammaproteobacteria bacterium]